MRVLLLEPDAARRYGVRRCLERRGHVVDVSESADAEGSSHPPDVLLVSAAVAARVPAAPPAPLVLLGSTGGAFPADAVRVRPLDAVLVDARGELADDEAARLEAAVARARGTAEAARLACACEASGAGLLLVSAGGRVERGNAAFSRLSGRPPETLAGSSLDALVVPEGDEAEGRAFAAALAGGPGWTGEARIERPGAPAVMCRASVASAGAGGGAVVTLLDLTRRVEAEASLLALNRTLEERSRLDPLSGLFNRAYLLEALERELSRARRYGHPLATLMVDLDDFKGINDAWGHDAGDEVLRAVAVALKAGFRDGDVVARYGGDEFCAVLPSTDDAGAAQVADRVREHVKALRLGPEGAVAVRASLGIATVADVAAEAQAGELVRLADRAMLAAKRTGGDRVVAHRGLAALGTAPATAPLVPRGQHPFLSGGIPEWWPQPTA